MPWPAGTTAAASPFLTAHTPPRREGTHSSPVLASCSWDLLSRARAAGMSLGFSRSNTSWKDVSLQNVRQQLSWPRALMSLKSPSRKPEGGGNSIWPQELQAFLFYIVAIDGNATLGVHRLSNHAGGWLQSGNEAISTLALGLCSG